MDSITQTVSKSQIMLKVFVLASLLNLSQPIRSSAGTASEEEGVGPQIGDDGNQRDDHREEQRREDLFTDWCFGVVRPDGAGRHAQDRQKGHQVPQSEAQRPHEMLCLAGEIAFAKHSGEKP